MAIFAEFNSLRLLLYAAGIVCVLCLCVTLAGQWVVANDGDAQTLTFLLSERNLVDLITLQVGLKPHTHTHTGLIGHREVEDPFIICRKKV